MKQIKFYMIAIIIITILVIGIIYFQYRDSRNANIGLFNSEQAEIHKVPEDVDIEDLELQLKKYHIAIDNAEKLLEEYNEANKK